MNESLNQSLKLFNQNTYLFRNKTSVFISELLRDTITDSSVAFFKTIYIRKTTTNKITDHYVFENVSSYTSMTVAIHRQIS